MADSLGNALGVALYVESKVLKLLAFARPVVMPPMRVIQALAYGVAALLGLVQVALTIWDALMLVLSGAPASFYGSLLGEHAPLSLHGFFIGLIYWVPLAYAALFFCLARILQLTTDKYRDADLVFRLSLL